jgi:fructose-bisphosphate aldolase class II
MHGGSGVSTADYKEVIKRGIRKINYYTYMSKAGAVAISNKEYGQFHDAVNDAIAAIKEDVKQAMITFGNL